MLTTDIHTIRSWICEVKDWQSYFHGEKLVYDVGMPHKIEVHKGYIIEVDGKAMQIPACMGWSCDANFHFFDSKADLHRILDAL